MADKTWMLLSAYLEDAISNEEQPREFSYREQRAVSEHIPIRAHQMETHAQHQLTFLLFGYFGYHNWDFVFRATLGDKQSRRNKVQERLDQTRIKQRKSMLMYHTLHRLQLIYFDTKD